MITKKILIGLLTSILAVTVLCMAEALNLGSRFINTGFTVSAETKGTYGDLKYKTYDSDKNGYDDSVSIYKIEHTSKATIEIPSYINGMPVKKIDMYAFSTAAIDTTLNKLVINENVEIISTGAFWRCWGLNYVTLPNSIKTIANDAFCSCPYLKSINFPEGLQYIGERAFYDSRLSGDLVLPSTLRTIEQDAFNSIKLNSVTILNPDCSIGGSNSSNWGATLSANTIYGYKNSTAQEFANACGKKFIALSEETINPPALLGDTNGNGNVNAADLVMLQQYLTKKDTLTDSANADMNGDGKIDVFDDILLRRLILKSK